MKWMIIAEIEGDKPSPKLVAKLKEDIENLIIESASEVVDYINIKAVSSEKSRK